MGVPAFLEKLSERMDYFGYDCTGAGTGDDGTVPEFLLPIANEFDRNGFRTKKKGGGYVAKAVHFDGNTSIQLANQAASLATDANTGLLTVWVRGSAIFGNNNTALLGDSSSLADAVIAGLAAGNSFGSFTFDSTGGDYYYNATTTPQNVVPSDSWTAMMMSWNMGVYPLVVQLYYGDVAQSIVTSGDSGGAFAVPIPYSDTKWTFIGSSANAFGAATNTSPLYQNGILGDAADYQLRAGGSFVDLSVTANRRKFIDALGKPVNPSVAAAAFGQATVLLSGDHTGFMVNQGSAGPVSAYMGFVGSALAAPGVMTLTGAVAGQTVTQVYDQANSTDVSSFFEATISVNDQIQQTSAGPPLTAGNTVNVTFPGALTDASSHP
jgi:hypothetical protein